MSNAKYLFESKGYYVFELSDFEKVKDLRAEIEKIINKDPDKSIYYIDASIFILGVIVGVYDKFVASLILYSISKLNT